MASLLLALWALGLALQPVAATVVLQTGNYSLSFADLPADFGPDIPPEGLQGLLLVADPEDACTELKLPPPDITSPWVALIVRSQEISGCTFDTKVAHAERAGAIASIIYDDVFEPLILMAKDPRHPDPFIPAVFVSHRSGLMMKRFTQEGKTVVILTPMNEQLWLSMLMSACAGFLAVNVVLGALWVIRRQRIVAGGIAGAGYGTLQRQGMTADEIRQLPIEVYEEPAAAMAAAAAAAAAGPPAAPRAAAGTGAGAAAVAGVSAAGATAVEAEDSSSGTDGLQPDQGVADAAASDTSSDSGRKGGGTRHTCAICLEGYSAGEKLRVLPCQHRYHSECVDTWLANRHPICPVCKADAHARTPESDLEAGGSLAAPAWQRRGTLLLGRLGAGWFALRRQMGGLAGAGRRPAEQQLLLPAGSRSSSPVPAAGEPAQPPAPAFLPASLASSEGSTAAGGPEITPVEATQAASPTATAAGTAAAAAAAAVAAAAAPPASHSPRWHASPPQACAGTGCHAVSPPSSAPPRSVPSSSPGASSSLGRAQLLPDSTEGSEMDSEAE